MTSLRRSIGIEGPGGKMYPLFLKDTQLPSMKTVKYKTAIHNQEAIKFNLLQSEDLDDASNNMTIGKYVCSGIPPAPAAKG